MSLRSNLTRDSLLFYELLEESESIEELIVNIDRLTDAFRTGVCDLCSDNGWDSDEIDCDIM